MAFKLSIAFHIWGKYIKYLEFSFYPRIIKMILSGRGSSSGMNTDEFSFNGGVLNFNMSLIPSVMTLEISL